MGNGTLSVALCHVVPKYIVICANVKGTGYVHYSGVDYGLRLHKYLYPLPFPFLPSFFLWHKKKEPHVQNNKDTV